MRPRAESLKSCEPFLAMNLEVGLPLHLRPRAQFTRVLAGWKIAQHRNDPLDRARLTKRKKDFSMTGQLVDWLLDSDPSIRWQVMRDLTDVPTDIVAAERARVAS